MIFAIQIVTSLIIEYRLIGAHTHTEMHTSTHAHKHTRMQAHTHASAHAHKYTYAHVHTHAHKVVMAGGMHNLRRTLFLQTISKYSHTGLLKGIDLLELTLLYDIRIHAVTFEWYCNDRIFEYCTIHFSTNLNIHAQILQLCIATQWV